MQWKDYFIESYKGMQDDCFEQYRKASGGSLPKDNKTIDDLIEFTDRAIQDEYDSYNECKALLNQLDDENYHTVLYLRYFKGLIVEEVADEMFYTTGYIVVLTAKAIKELERIQ